MVAKPAFCLSGSAGGGVAECRFSDPAQPGLELAFDVSDLDAAPQANSFSVQAEVGGDSPWMKFDLGAALKRLAEEIELATPGGYRCVADEDGGAMSSDGWYSTITCSKKANS